MSVGLESGERVINLRCVVTASAKHDCDIWEVEPHMVIPSEIVDEIAHKLVALGGHHEADGEAGRVRGWSDKLEASQGPQTAFAR